MKTHTIKKGGYYPNIIGRDPRMITALIIDVPPNETVHIGALDVGHADNCVCWVSGKNLIIDSIYSHHYSEDNVQVRASNMLIKRMRWGDLLPTTSKRHPDRGIQAYAVEPDGYTLNPNGLIENIEIQDIKGKLLQAIDQFIMLSERNEYSGFFIGGTRFEVEMAGYEWVVSAHTINHSIFGGDHVKTDGGILIKNRKNSDYETKEVYCQGFDVVNTDAANDTIILPARMSA